MTDRHHVAEAAGARRAPLSPPSDAGLRSGAPGRLRGRVIWLAVYGYYIPANVRVGLSVPQVATTLSCLFFMTTLNGFMMKGVADRNGNKYEDLVEQLVQRGVQFDVCEITLRNRKLSRDQFISYSTFVPSGVAEITRLQQREGYAYLRP